MENELHRVVDALPGLVWTALPDGHIDFLNQRWCADTGLSVDEAYGRGGRRRSTPQTCRSCSNAGDPCWLLASHVTWKRACGASMGSIAGSSAVLVRLPTHPDRSSPAAAWKTIPSWDGVSSDDQAINPALERFDARRIGATTTQIKASHAPFLSHPQEVARVIEAAARGSTVRTAQETTAV